MTPSKKKAAAPGAWLVSADADRWEPSGADTADAAAKEFASAHKLMDGFVFVRDPNGRERRFKVIPKKKRTPVTGTVKS